MLREVNVVCVCVPPEAKLQEARPSGPALVAQHPDSWEAARGLQDAERLLLSSEAFVSRYEARVAAQPGDALAHYLWGRARIDVPDVAGPAFARAAALAPQSPWPVAALAHLHRSAGDLFLTVQTYKEGIGRMPRSALLRLLLGAQLIDLNLYVEAQRHLELARQLAPDSPAVATALGRVYAALSRPEEAQALLLESYAIDPRQGDCARELARLALKARRVEDAEAYDRAALELGQPRDEALTSAIRAAKVRQGR